MRGTAVALRDGCELQRVPRRESTMQEQRDRRERPAGRDVVRSRRSLAALWLSTIPVAIVAALLTRWLCPEASVGLPMSMAALLVVPAAIHTFLIRPGPSR